jgi:hypothetical protein
MKLFRATAALAFALTSFAIPASVETSGHSTTGSAKFYKQQLQELLQTAPQKAM